MLLPLQEEFQQKVINYFCQTYLQGETHLIRVWFVMLISNIALLPTKS
jgi:hypothetical protein